MKMRQIAEDKLRILEKAQHAYLTASEVCRRYQIDSSLFCVWEAQAKRGALDALSAKSRKRKADPDTLLRAEL